MRGRCYWVAYATHTAKAEQLRMVTIGRPLKLPALRSTSGGRPSGTSAVFRKASYRGGRGNPDKGNSQPLAAGSEGVAGGEYLPYPFWAALAGAAMPILFFNHLHLKPAGF